MADDKNEKNQQGAPPQHPPAAAAKTAAERQKEKDKVPEIKVPVPPSVFALLGSVGSSSMGMLEARQAMRKWVASLTDEEREQLKIDAERIGRTMVAAAEGLSQELTILSAGL